MIISDTDRCCNDCNSWSDSTGVERDARSAPGRTLAGGPLGIVTKTTSTQAGRGPQAEGFDTETGEIHEPNPQSARANRWALKSVVNRLLPGSRTSKCMVLRAPIPGYGLADIDLCKGQIHKKAFYQGLMACGGVWTCPVCAAKVSERRRQELKDAIQAAGALGMAVHFVTLTVPHGVGDDIKVMNDKLSQALKRLSNGMHSVKNKLRAMCPDSELHGYIRAFEVTHGDHGFHPHYHILVFTSRDLHASVINYVYGKAWQRACRLADLPEPSLEHGCTVQDGLHAAQYASKWGLEDEMTKAQTKQTKRKGATPWGLLRAVLDGDDLEYPPQRASALFRVYAAAFSGRRQLYWSNGLRKLLAMAPERSDEELVAAPEDERASVLATLTPEQWKAIRRRRQEAHLLTVAESAPSLLTTVIDAACQPTRRRSERLARTTTPEGAGDPPIHRLVNLPRFACLFPSQ